LSAASDAAPRAILLDALGTLVALEPPAPFLRAELLARFGLELSEADCARAIGAEIEYYRAHLDEGRDRDSLRELRRRCASALRRALPGPAQDVARDLAALTEALLASIRFRSYSDAAPALGEWRERGLRLVVASNWDVSLHDVLERVGLGSSLDAVLTSAEAGARKPDPAIFGEALRLAGVRPEQAIHIGDSVEEDVRGARAAGIEPVLLARDGAAPDLGVRTIVSLTELTAGP
jgi:putative hydrolase of the HAD superfamily